MSAQKTKGPVFDPGLCRCCGAMKKCRLLNVTYESNGLKEMYSDMFMDCFGLLLSHLDSKPTERLVCATCVNRLRDALAFRKQVLDREEAFLNMKMFENEDKDPQPTEVMLFEIDTKITPVVKVEPGDMSDGDDARAGSADSNAGEDVRADSVVTADETVEAKKAVVKKVKTESHKELSSDDLPLIQRKTKKVTKVRWKTRAELQKMRVPVVNKPVTTKPQLPMSKVQQLIRERDPTYMMETNLLTIVEYSYVCPFKCRHNHLLCFYCGEDFLDPKLLREHTAKCHHPKKFKITEHKNMLKLDLTRIDCRLCETTIDNLDDFKQHISSVHSKKYYFNHKDSVLPFKLTKDEYKCAVCDMGFAYFHALNKHMNVHYSNYVCETCGLGFVDKGRFVMHQQRHEESDFPCEVCGKVFKAQYNKDLHVDRVHKKRGRVYCPKCDIKLMSYPQKLKHLVEVHGEEPLSFPCNMCDKIYYTRRTLTIHRRKDHLNDYRYECNCCGQKFFTRFALNNHMPTHTGERNFKCKVCEKSYPRLKTLKDHMRIHTNDRRYRCHICGQAFIQNCSLKGHMKSQHPEYG